MARRTNNSKAKRLFCGRLFLFLKLFFAGFCRVANVYRVGVPTFIAATFDCFIYPPAKNTINQSCKSPVIERDNDKWRNQDFALEDLRYISLCSESKNAAIFNIEKEAECSRLYT